MMKVKKAVPPRYEELAAAIALGDCTEAELFETRTFDQELFENMATQMEEVAAKAYLSFDRDLPHDEMPAALADRLRAMSCGYLGRSVGGDDPSLAVLPERSQLLREQTIAPELWTPPSTRFREVLAWLCVAASIALALCVWLPDAKSTRRLSTSEARDSLIASSKDLLRLDWSSTDPVEADRMDFGQVVWSTKSQEGFMTIRGLPANDPTKEQYQLWIIDPSRDSKPVDGGVFDITSNIESVIPILAKLQVDQPTVFAITVEKPGGVVVSDQKRLPLIAKVP
jgi:hypothetical protein